MDNANNVIVTGNNHDFRVMSPLHPTTGIGSLLAGSVGRLEMPVTIKVLIFVATMVLSIIYSMSSPAGELKVLFRYDDYSSLSDTAFEKRMLQELERLGVGVIVGVIPFPGAQYPVPNHAWTRALDLPGEKITLLRHYAQRGVVHIAVHGHSHKDNRKGLGPSEFAGLPPALQYRLLRDARTALSEAFGKDITTFIPPFNTVDANTIHALQEAGFRLMSAGGLTPPLIEKTKLAFLPAGPYPIRLRSVAGNILSSGHGDGILLVSAHAYDFADSNSDLPEFRIKSGKEKTQVNIDQFIADLKWLKSHDGVRFTTLDRLLAQGEDLSAQRLRANMRWRESFITQHQLLPGAFAYPLVGLYYPVHTARMMYWWQQAFVILFYGGMFIINFLATQYLLSWMLKRRLLTINRALGICLAIGVISWAIVAYKAMQDSFYLSSAILLALSMGIVVAAIHTHLRTLNPRLSAT